MIFDAFDWIACVVAALVFGSTFIAGLVRAVLERAECRPGCACVYRLSERRRR